MSHKGQQAVKAVEALNEQPGSNLVFCIVFCILQWTFIKIISLSLLMAQEGKGISYFHATVTQNP